MAGLAGLLLHRAPVVRCGCSRRCRGSPKMAVRHELLVVAVPRGPEMAGRAGHLLNSVQVVHWCAPAAPVWLGSQNTYLAMVLAIVSAASR